MPPADMSFVYPPLAAGVDALRVLTVAPGDFYDPLKGTLIPLTFSQKPKYVALSYTWGAPHPDTSTIPVSPNHVGYLSRSPDASQRPPAVLEQDPARVSLTEVLPGLRDSASQTVGRNPASLTVNDQPLHVGHNLHLALLHLRSPIHPVSIWIDAICINQADVEERNQQVSLMSFIYKRAIRVIAWLGTKHYTSMSGLFRTMSLEWKAGQTQHFAASLAGEEVKSWIRCSPKPTQGTLVRIAESSYWLRLWIVQEVCLPRVLFLVYGSEIWVYEDFRRWASLLVAEQSLPLQVNAKVFGAMQLLLETREKRHTGHMTLEALIERFAKNKCSEVKDRVYGLIGAANDIHPFAAQYEDAKVEAVQNHVSPPRTEHEPMLMRRRGAGSLKVDYSSSCYEIWTSVVKFVFFQAKSVEGRVHVRLGRKVQEQVMDGQGDHISNEERGISIVRTAGIVQDALGQRVEGESAFLRHHPDDSSLPVIRAVGYIAGEILRFGPEYTSLVGSSRAQQEWTTSWVDYYDQAEDLEVLRRVSEDYEAKIMNCEEEDIGRIQDICKGHVTAWPVSRDGCQAKSSNSGRTRTTAEIVWTDTPVKKGEPRICLGTGYMIGLVPPAAKLGDVVVRFWNCDAAIVMRPVTTSGTTTATSSYKLVGRADVAEVIDRKATPGQDPRAEQCMSNGPAPGFKSGSQHMGALHVDLSLRVLQMVTAYIDT